MKNTIALLFLFLVGVPDIWAQRVGTITYDDVRDVHRRLTGNRERFKEMIPQFKTDRMLLIYDEQQSVYKAAPKTDEELAVQNEGGRRGFMMRMAGPGGGTLWQNYREQKRVEERDFMDKKFLITGEPHKYAWKMTPETKQVGQYLCHKATFQDSARQIVAWFTTMIPVPLGPSEFGQLPGLILHVDVNDGERTITATDLNFDAIDSSTISEPKKGKEITEEKFRKVVREKMEEMREQRGEQRVRIRN